MPERSATFIYGSVDERADRLEALFSGSPTRNTIFCPAQQNFPVQIYMSGFFCGKPYAKCNFLSSTRKDPVHLEVDRTLFWGEALSKTQISGANTRLALIIFKRSNGNWIFLRWLARASLSRDCFNSLLASCSNIVPGPRGLTGHGDALQIINMFYNRCCSHPSVAPPNQKINSNTSNKKIVTTFITPQGDFYMFCSCPSEGKHVRN